MVEPLGRDIDQAVLLVTAKRFLRNAFVDVAYDNVSVVLTPAAEPRSLAVTPAEETTPTWMLLAVALLLLALIVVAAAWLSADMLVEATELKAEIGQWLAKKRAERAAALAS